MRLNYNNVGANNRTKPNLPFKALAPLVALVVFGCAKTYKDQSGISIAGKSNEQIVAMHKDIARQQYGTAPRTVNVREQNEVCVSYCDANPEDGQAPFNYSNKAVLVDLSGRGVYHKYAYTARGERLWEGIGNDQKRVFVMRDATGKPILVKETRKMDHGWVSWDTSSKNAATIWRSAVAEFMEPVHTDRLSQGM